jgi:hypothetical protein
MPPSQSKNPMRCALIATIVALGGLGSAAASIAMAQDADKRTQSENLFRQIASVLLSPRCINCHPRGDYPAQGDDRHRHHFNVSRGPDDYGAPGLHCNTCHQSENQTASGVPGAEDWHLAPLRMAWDGYTPGDLCRALLDPKRGGMRPEQFVDHFNTVFVVWAFSPGTDFRGVPRTVPPISHEQFIDVTKQWVATGAACPK